MNGCYEESRIEEMDKADRYKMAKKLLEKEDYQSALLNFEIITSTARGFNFIDSAFYYLAMCHYYQKEYISAASELNRLITDLPSSGLADDAQYMIGMSYFELSPKFSLDQQYTKKAVVEFEKLLNYYPRSNFVDDAKNKLRICENKLAKKDYKSGELYINLKNYDAAIIYFNSILENYPDSDWVKAALFKKGETLFKLKRFNETKNIIQTFLRIYPDSEYTEKANNLIKKADSENK